MAQGRENARAFLEDNTELCNELEAKIREKLTVKAEPEKPETEAPPEE